MPRLTSVLILRRLNSASLLAGILMLLNFSACKRAEIRVYTVPKDVPPPQVAAHSDHPSSSDDRSEDKPQISWSLPDGWQEIDPGKVSLASFTVKTDGGEANVTITPLPNLKGREAMVVNMWREQAGLAPLEEAAIAKEFKDVQIGDEKGQLFEVAGKRENGNPVKIVTAFVHKPDSSWFYKISGDEAAVNAQESAFVAFLKSVHVKEGAPASSMAGHPQQPSAELPHVASDTPKFQWKVPSDWKPLEAGQMQVAKFAVPDQGNAKAEVFVSVFPSDTGGTVANVNRWRNQIGLGPVSETDLPNIVSSLDPSIPNAVVITLSNDSRHLIGAIVPRDDRWWFYKLLGDAAAVDPQRDAFISFAKSAPQ